MHIGEREIGAGIAGIEHDGLVRQRFGQSGRIGDGAGQIQDGVIEVGVDEALICPRESRVESDGTPEEGPGKLILGCAALGMMPEAPVIRFPCAEALGWLQSSPLVLGLLDRRLDRRRDGSSDLVLCREDIAQLALIALGPEVSAGIGPDQLAGNPDLVAGRSHAAFEDITHAELAPDLTDIDGAGLVGKCRITGDHEQRSELGQGERHILDDAVG